MAEGASLTVMAGPRAGTRLLIDQAVDEILIGSDPDCRLSLDLPGVSPIHARLWRDLAGMTVYDTRSPSGVYVNDDRVTDQAPLRDGDILWLGAPGDADSVMLQCRVPPPQMAAPVPLAAPAEAEEPAPEMDAAPLEPEFEVEHGRSYDTPPAPGVVYEEGEAIPVSTEEPEIVTEAWAEQAYVAPAPPAAAPPEAPARDEDFMVEPAVETAAVAADAAAIAAPALDLDALMDAPPQTSAPAPAPEPEGGDDLFILDEPAGADAPAPPVEEDTFFVDEAVPAVPPATPMPVSPLAAAPSASPAAPVRAASPAAAPPAFVPPAGPAIIDDTATGVPEGWEKPRDRDRKPGRSSSGAPAPGSYVFEPSAAPPDAAGQPSGVRRPTGPPSAGPAPRGAAPRGRAPLIGGIVAAVLLLGAGGYVLMGRMKTPRLASIAPARASVGQPLTLTGENFSAAASANDVRIGGKPAKVTQAGEGRLQVVIPELPAVPGRDTATPVVVTVDGRASAPASFGLYQAPRLSAMTPEVAMPGDDVVLTGGGWATGVKVRFGSTEATVVEVTPGTLKVKVPALTVAPGAEVPVAASMGSDPSNALTLTVGRVPLVLSATPQSAAPGEVVTLAGRGFDGAPQSNSVRVGGQAALVLSASARELKVIVPRGATSEAPVEVRVPGSDTVGQATLAVTPAPDPIDFRFVAEPFDDGQGHDHAAVSTFLGPALILSGAGGKTAAQRAEEAARRLGEALAVLRSSAEADVRARYEGTPALILYGRDTVLVEVTEADAQAYNEEWARQRGKAVEVTVPRLAAWWEAVLRDLVLMLVRGEAPRHAGGLAAEGRILADLHQAARRVAGVGVPASVLAQARPAVRDGVRTLALRVPGSVTAPAPGGAPGETAEPAVPFKAEGTWGGSETENGIARLIVITFQPGGGTLSYQRALSLSLPLIAVQQQKSGLRFQTTKGGGTRYYQGQWDGAKVAGRITSDAAGRTEIGTFEISPR